MTGQRSERDGIADRIQAIRKDARNFFNVDFSQLNDMNGVSLTAHFIDGGSVTFYLPYRVAKDLGDDGLVFIIQEFAGYVAMTGGKRGGVKIWDRD